MFFLVPLFYIGQTKKSDSLKTHILNWKNQTGLKADTMLHKAYKDYGLLFMPDNPDSSNFFLLKAINVLVKYDNQNIKISDCLILIGWNFYTKGDFYSAKAKYIDAIKMLNQEFDRANKNEIVELTAKGLYNLGILLSNEGNYNFAIRAYDVSERIYSLTGNEKNVARSKVAKAIVYSLKNINSKALSEYFNGLKIYEKLDNISMQTSILGNIGFTYYNLKEYDKALDYYHRALTLAQKQKNLIYEAQLHENIGFVYDEQLYQIYQKQKKVIIKLCKF